MKKTIITLLITISITFLGIGIYNKYNGKSMLGGIDINVAEYRMLYPNVYYDTKNSYIKEYLPKINKQDLQEISTFMKNNYPDINILIENLTKGNLDGVEVYGFVQIVDNVILDETECNMYVNGNNVSTEPLISKSKFIHNMNFKQEQLINETNIKEIIKDYFNGDYSKAYYLGSKKIEFHSFLQYTKNGQFEWIVNINASQITIDARTGKIIDTYFWDGVMYD